MFKSFLCIVCERFLVKLTFVEKQIIFITVLYELNLFHFKVRVISWNSSWRVYKHRHRQKAVGFNSHLKPFYVGIRSEFYIKIKPIENKILYLLDIF
jgi:hypothetical protein